MCVRLALRCDSITALNVVDCVLKCVDSACRSVYKCVKVRSVNEYVLTIIVKKKQVEWTYVHCIAVRGCMPCWPRRACATRIQARCSKAYPPVSHALGTITFRDVCKCECTTLTFAVYKHFKQNALFFNQKHKYLFEVI